MWAALKKAHQDNSSGGRMYWLQKLVEARMMGSNVDSHINKMRTYAEKLNALISIDNPLTADDVHSTALLISLPSDWLHRVSSLMNKEQVSSNRIVAALKAESLRQKTRGEGDASNRIAVARADVSSTTSVNNQAKLYCSFCKRPNHDLNNCNNLAKLIKEHKEKRHEDYLARQSTSSKPSKSTSKLTTNTPAKAGHTTVVELDNLFSDNNDLVESEFKISGAAAVASLVNRMSQTRQTDFNLDLGCLVLMTPFLSTINSPAVNSTPVCLADRTLVRSTHSGHSTIPLVVNTTVKTLVVPNLHEPLLSVGALCDEGFSVCFDRIAC
jgi:hypothetical protein